MQPPTCLPSIPFPKITLPKITLPKITLKELQQRILRRKIEDRVATCLPEVPNQSDIQVTSPFYEFLAHQKQKCSCPYHRLKRLRCIPVHAQEVKSLNVSMHHSGKKVAALPQIRQTHVPLSKGELKAKAPLKKRKWQASQKLMSRATFSSVNGEFDRFILNRKSHLSFKEKYLQSLLLLIRRNSGGSVYLENNLSLILNHFNISDLIAPPQNTVLLKVAQLIGCGVQDTRQILQALRANVEQLEDYISRQITANGYEGLTAQQRRMYQVLALSKSNELYGGDRSAANERSASGDRSDPTEQKQQGEAGLEEQSSQDSKRRNLVDQLSEESDIVDPHLRNSKKITNTTFIKARLSRKPLLFQFFEELTLPKESEEEDESKESTGNKESDRDTRNSGVARKSRVSELRVSELRDSNGRWESMTNKSKMSRHESIMEGERKRKDRRKKYSPKITEALELPEWVKDSSYQKYCSRDTLLEMTDQFSRLQNEEEMMKCLQSNINILDFMEDAAKMNDFYETFAPLFGSHKDAMLVRLIQKRTQCFLRKLQLEVEQALSSVEKTDPRLDDDPLMPGLKDKRKENRLAVRFMEYKPEKSDNNVIYLHNMEVFQHGGEEEVLELLQMELDGFRQLKVENAVQTVRQPQEAEEVLEQGLPIKSTPQLPPNHRKILQFMQKHYSGVFRQLNADFVHAGKFMRRQE